MPCNSDYMEANSLEKNLSRVLLLLKEIDTGVPVDANSSDWNGYMHGIYGADRVYLRETADKAVERLCSILKKTKDVYKYSLEMQVWWKEHQEADRIREEKEKKEASSKKIREKALKKLTKAERKSLGLD